MSGAKSRLSNILNDKEREIFAFSMLEDVIRSLKSSSLDEIVILATSPDGITEITAPYGVEYLVDERDLNSAINSILMDEVDPVMIVMSDLPLLTGSVIDEMLGFEEEVVIAPGMGGGTNILLLRSPSRFRVDYYGNSLQDHISIARERGLSLRIYYSFLAAVDMDEESDLIELLIHGDGKASSYLRSLGFYVNGASGRVRLKREV
ncbi:MAG: Coenzyme F420, CofC [Candidatus Syntrophoarchaeum butanivorans]|uniref:2-phospho-L-lactate guanylyltransferase n=1 Tax=Candidatus Syntropharchaeum butanivorans TaxID=1839936 RepID=A0A1F2P6U0_9EURY|nr:MAG: Coenzyme F420, CofC [Candidatus Syntrophoarchaeum butanivorans]